MNTRENFWNVNCFTTNQVRDETAKDNCQTAVLRDNMSHKLDWGDAATLNVNMLGV